MTLQTPDQGSEGPTLPRGKDFPERRQDHFRAHTEVGIWISSPYFRLVFTMELLMQGKAQNDWPLC